MRFEPVIDITGNKWLPAHMRAETRGSRLLFLRHVPKWPCRRMDGHWVEYELTQRRLSGVPRPGSADVCCTRGGFAALWSRLELDEAGLLDRGRPMFDIVTLMI